MYNKKVQLSLTNPRDAEACQKLLRFDVLKRYRWQYWSIFIGLAVVVSEICEIPRNSLTIQTYIVQGNPRSSIGVNWKPMYDFLLVINSNFGRISIT